MVNYRSNPEYLEISRRVDVLVDSHQSMISVALHGGRDVDHDACAAIEVETEALCERLAAIAAEMDKAAKVG